MLKYKTDVTPAVGLIFKIKTIAHGRGFAVQGAVQKAKFHEAIGNKRMRGSKLFHHGTDALDDASHKCKRSVCSIQLCEVSKAFGCLRPDSNIPAFMGALLDLIQCISKMAGGL